MTKKINIMKRLFTILIILIICKSACASLFRKYQVEDGLSHNSVWTVMQDKRGFMWFGTVDGLNKFDGINFKVYKKQQEDSLSIGNNFNPFNNCERPLPPPKITTFFIYITI